MQDENFTHRRGGRPARITVVAVVKNPARLEEFARELDDNFLILGANPRPDSVQINRIELGQIRAIEHFLKAVVEKFAVAAGRGAKFVGVSGVRRIEVRAEITAEIRRRVNVQRNALPKAQLAIIFASVRFSRRETFRQQAEFLKSRIELAVVAVGVSRFGEVAVIPGVQIFCLLVD